MYTYLYCLNGAIYDVYLLQVLSSTRVALENVIK